MSSAPDGPGWTSSSAVQRHTRNGANRSLNANARISQKGKICNMFQAADYLVSKRKNEVASLYPLILIDFSAYGLMLSNSMYQSNKENPEHDQKRGLNELLPFFDGQNTP
jgi:hypothetical protein